MFLTRNIKDYISNKYIYGTRDIHYWCNLKKVESNRFYNTL